MSSHGGSCSVDREPVKGAPIFHPAGNGRLARGPASGMCDAGDANWSPVQADSCSLASAEQRRTDSRRQPDLMLASRAGASISRVDTNVDIPGLGVRSLWVRLRSGTEGLLVPLRAGDGVNLYLVGFDGTKRRVTHGTGVESWPAISPSGEIIFTRSKQVPKPCGAWTWAPTTRDPTKEASPARMFGRPAMGPGLVFGSNARPR